MKRRHNDPSQPPKPKPLTNLKPGQATQIVEYYLRESREGRTSLLKGMLAIGKCPEELRHIGPAKVLDHLGQMIRWSEAQTMKIAAAMQGKGGPFLIDPTTTKQGNRFDGQPIVWEDPDDKDAKN
jgi:hypothetical protein